MEDVVRHVRWIVVREGERPPGARIVGIPRYNVRMQVRKRIAEQVVVQLDRLEGSLDRPPFAAIWDDILPPTPDDVWQANLDLVRRAMTE